MPFEAEKKSSLDNRYLGDLPNSKATIFSEDEEDEVVSIDFVGSFVVRRPAWMARRREGKNSI